MSEVKSSIEELNFEGVESFNASRLECVGKFKKDICLFKRKITQGLYWTALDKDLANQFLRDERWLFGVKFWDALKIIDHGADGTKDSQIGFKSKK